MDKMIDIHMQRGRCCSIVDRALPLLFTLWVYVTIVAILTPALAVESIKGRPVRSQLEEGISFERYGAAGLLGTFVGFGSGHAVAKQWKQAGWIYTVSESIAAAGMVTGFAMLMEDLFCGGGGLFGSGECKYPNADSLMLGSFSVFLVMRGIEMVDIWIRPKVIQKQDNKIIRKDPPEVRSSFLISPNLSPNIVGLTAGWRF